MTMITEGTIYIVHLDFSKAFDRALHDILAWDRL